VYGVVRVRVGYLLCRSVKSIFNGRFWKEPPQRVIVLYVKKIFLHCVFLK
jgi:hypothetical protein